MRALVEANIAAAAAGVSVAVVVVAAADAGLAFVQQPAVGQAAKKQLN